MQTFRLATTRFSQIAPYLCREEDGRGTFEHHDMPNFALEFPQELDV
jgi:hypothetical protein